MDLSGFNWSSGINGQLKPLIKVTTQELGGSHKMTEKKQNTTKKLIILLMTIYFAIIFVWLCASLLEIIKNPGSIANEGEDQIFFGISLMLIFAAITGICLIYLISKMAEIVICNKFKARVEGENRPTV